MTLEEKLREMILNKYHSMREFSTRIDVPNSTVESILKRGVQNSSVSNVIKLCKGLNISVEALAEGKIKKVNHSKQRKQELKAIRKKYKIAKPGVFKHKKTNDLEKIINDAIEDINNLTTPTINGQPIKHSDVNSIVDTINFGVGIINKRLAEED